MRFYTSLYLFLHCAIDFEGDREAIEKCRVHASSPPAQHLLAKLCSVSIFRCSMSYLPTSGQPGKFLFTEQIDMQHETHSRLLLTLARRGFSRTQLDVGCDGIACRALPIMPGPLMIDGPCCRYLIADAYLRKVMGSKVESGCGLHKRCSRRPLLPKLIH
jgi:hypothetical protein